MNRFIKTFILTFLISWPIKYVHAQEGGLEVLEFMVGKWEAHAKDSSFSSVLTYQFSPNKRMLMATNYLYNREGQRFAIYEGAYLFEVDHLAYFVAGPGGETHRGTAETEGDRLIHKARLYPGKKVKSYLSEFRLEGNSLMYYASYSDQETFPTQVDYSNPLIYIKIE